MFISSEKHLSQIPALQLLIKLGYQYLPPSLTIEQRQGKLSNVLLENILRTQLEKLNHIEHKGKDYPFSEANIETAIQKLKNTRFDGLLKNNEQIYDLITLGTALEQTINGDKRSFTLHYIDWENPQNNTYHVSAEYSVASRIAKENKRPDIVLFINGIPLAVIECKAPEEDIDQAISQTIRNQKSDNIPQLYQYAQLVMGIKPSQALYATAGTPKQFWATWREEDENGNESDLDTIRTRINEPLTEAEKQSLFTGDFTQSRAYFDQLAGNPRLVTDQDKALYRLCRPERLLELTYRYIVFDNGLKKIARYQQYFVVKSALDRVQQIKDGQRQGGIIWHTQGSGKSLSMVMLARNLALDKTITAPRIVLVTDRVDLDKQLHNTFAACGLEPERAKSGRHLLGLVAENKASIITTIINKFDAALNVKKHRDESKDIFMLVDESHRGNYGSLAARMRQMFPNACYLGFTGTPLTKREKNSFARFGGLIKPYYSIQRAVEDGAVVPLLYEGRHVSISQDKAAIDRWFERVTADLTPEQKADLKRKYARAEELNKTEKVIRERAYDIRSHFVRHWKGTGFKAQLVAPGKWEAIRYHEILTEFGDVSTAVIISPPDDREGHEAIDTQTKDIVQQFWKRMMERYGNEENYNKLLIDQFKNAGEPEILIVVDKLLTGFDAPRNTVLYLTRNLREHTLLQAIARVNRLFVDESGEPKEFGHIIDYASILGELDKALTMYADAGLQDFDEADLAAMLTALRDEVAKLPQRHAAVWELFKTIENKQDEEAYERLLADDELRDTFYERLSSFAKALDLALSNDQFIAQTAPDNIHRYKQDLRRFMKLRKSVSLRYQEEVSYKNFGSKIKKLLDEHISAGETYQLNEPINIFDPEPFEQLQKDQGIFHGKSKEAKADMIAHAMKRAITERQDEDPAFYKRFSKLIQATIDAWQQQRIEDHEYLQQMLEHRYNMTHKIRSDIPEALKDNEHAQAFYGALRPHLADLVRDADSVAEDAAQYFAASFDQHMVVDYWDNETAKHATENAIDDYLYDEIKHKYGADLSTDEMDAIIAEAFRIAKRRYQ